MNAEGARWFMRKLLDNHEIERVSVARKGDAPSVYRVVNWERYQAKAASKPNTAIAPEKGDEMELGGQKPHRNNNDHCEMENRDWESLLGDIDAYTEEVATPEKCLADGKLKKSHTDLAPEKCCNPAEKQLESGRLISNNNIKEESVQPT